ncbi:hypothetical protein [Motilimonas sp. E26]|nr:hypothetical protein [Motilimonas sp. E26]
MNNNISNKVILVVLDGLNYQVAHDCIIGYLNGLIEFVISHIISSRKQL